MTSSGATAVKVKVVFKDRGRRTVRHLGSAHDEAELAVLMARALQVAEAGQMSLDLEPLGASGACVAPGGAVMGSTRSAVLVRVLEHAWSALGLDAAVEGDEGLRQMVLARLVEPTSKERVPRVVSEIGIDPLSVRTLLRSLRRCTGKGWRASVQAALRCHVSAGGDLSLVLYDVTTLYFETDKEDDLRKVGFFKERRVGPQVAVGVLVDRSGLALQVGCWEGNPAATRTIIHMVRQLLDAHLIEPAGLVVVADAGTMSLSNLTALDKAGLGFIIGSKTTRAPYPTTWPSTPTFTATPTATAS